MDKGEGGGLVIADILRTWGEGGSIFCNFVRTSFMNSPLCISIGWQKFNWLGPIPLVVDIIVDYCYTRVLFYTKNAKRNWNWRNIRLFVSFLSLVAFQFEGCPGPLGHPGYANGFKTCFWWLDNHAMKLPWPFLPFVILSAQTGWLTQ